MKQVLQNISNGETIIENVPAPKNKKSNLLISTSKTLLSAGTERMLIEFGKANLINKARQQPDKVKMVIDKVSTDGLLTTFDAIKTKLDQPLALGYCNAGVVLESQIDEYKVGDRVASNCHHAEIVRCPKNLCAKIPDNVDDESAAFTVIGAIALQGVRLAKPTIGECFVVSGLGIVGLMTVQILKANGCRVLGIDYDSNRCKLAEMFGAETVNLSKNPDPISAARIFSRDRGVDGVIITASSESHDVIHQAATMCRKRGRLILVGVVGLNLRRDDFFEKELTFQVSASYGPGRYDSKYEDEGHDYPFGYVRWTEQRNFEAVLDMMSSGEINVKPIISHRYKIDSAEDAYKALDQSSSLGIILDFEEKNIEKIQASKVDLKINQINKHISGSLRVGFIGAGNYASRTLIPEFKKNNLILDTIVSSSGVSSTHHGKKNGFETSSSDINDVLNNEQINAVVIATRHGDHSTQVINALNHKKNVFVEKPLAINLEELNKIESCYNKIIEKHNLKLMVGFNRRFSPLTCQMKNLVDLQSMPKSFIVTVNAGNVQFDHWIHNPDVGGGRIVGEACHFIDLLRYLSGSRITDFQCTKLGSNSGLMITNDKSTITLAFEDGSMGTIHYFSNGGNAFPKERVEVFCNNAVLQLNNYRSLIGYGWPKFKKTKLFKQNKGQKECVKAFIDSISSSVSPISFEELLEVSKISIEISDELNR